jgi:large exoprotein involved in heme utilization and adhesion
MARRDRFGKDAVRNQSALSGLFANTEAGSSGNSGTIQLEAGTLTLNNGTISTETASTVGGNINLNVRNILFLRNGSQISARVGAQGTGGDGGNIAIDANLIVAVPGENNDITANAFEGQGGNINIASQGIFGLQEQTATPGNNTNDIDASSALGIDGTVNITTPEVDPTAGVIELPLILVDADTLIAQDVCAIEDGKIAGGSSFVVTGRGGLPPSADDPLVNSYRIVEWATRWSDRNAREENPSNDNLPTESRLFDGEAESQENGTVALRDRPKTDEPGQRSYPAIQQARGWGVAPDGTILLTAQALTVAPHNPGLTHPQCHFNSQLAIPH